VESISVKKLKAPAGAYMMNFGRLDLPLTEPDKTRETLLEVMPKKEQVVISMRMYDKWLRETLAAMTSGLEEPVEPKAASATASATESANDE
jgi:hypothetical protein